MANPQNTLRIEIPIIEGRDRLIAIDGLRGAAILLVIGFHFFGVNARAPLLPYGTTFSDVSMFKYGFMGVELFFMISGFVISLTLETCQSPFEFATKRVARIWPALIVASIITFAVLNSSPSPFANLHRPQWLDFIPSLTLTPNRLWSEFFPDIDMIASVYWSLVVEIQFYIIAALIYWRFDQKNFARNLVVFTILGILLRAGIKRIFPQSADLVYHIVTITDFMPWFAAGAIFFELYKFRYSKTLAAVLLFAMFLITVRTSTFSERDISPWIMCLFGATFFLAFWMVSTRYRVAAVLRFKPLVFVGMISYSLYLFHEAIGLTLLTSISSDMPKIRQFFAVLLVLAGMILLGYLSFKLVENPGRKFLIRILISKDEKTAIARTQP